MTLTEERNATSGGVRCPPAGGGAVVDARAANGGAAGDTRQRDGLPVSTTCVRVQIVWKSNLIFVLVLVWLDLKALYGAF